MKKFNVSLLSMILLSSTILGPIPVLATEDNGQVERSQEESIENETSSSESFLEELTPFLKPNETRSETSLNEQETEAVVEEELTKESPIKETRAVNEVSTFAELIVALRTPSVTEIRLTANITATSNIDNIPVRTVTIDGAGKTLTMGNFLFTKFSVGNGVINFQNVTLRGVPGGDPIIMDFAQTWAVNFDNVKVEYARLQLLKADVTFSGENLFTTSVSLGTAGVSYLYRMGSVLVSEDSSLVINIPTPGKGNVLLGETVLSLEKNAELKIGQDKDVTTNIDSVGVYGFKQINLAPYSLLKLRTTGVGLYQTVTNSSLLAESESIVDIESSYIGMRLYPGNRYFEPGATLLTRGSYCGIYSHSGAKVNVNQPKELLIESLTGKAAIVATGNSYAELTLTQTDTSAWKTIADPQGVPTFIWEALDIRTTILNTSTTIQATNNQDAKANFKATTFRKISGKGHGYLSELNLTGNELTDKDTTISGTATPNSAIAVKIGGDTYTGKTSSNGDYLINFGKTYPAKTEAIVTATLGNLTKELSLIVKDVTPPSKPDLNPLTDESTEATGNAEADSTVVIKVGNTILGQGIADKNGNFAIAIPAQKEGTKVTATATDESGNESPEGSVVVSGIVLPKPTINQISDKDVVVTGKASANATVTLSIAQAGGGNMVYSGTADKDGNYSIQIAKQVAGTEVKAVASLNGKTSGEVTTTVIDKTPPAAPTIDGLTDQSVTAKGKAEANSTVILTVNNQVIGTTKATAAGTYSVTIKKQVAGTVVSVTATDASGNESVATKTTVTKLVTEGTIKANDYVATPDRDRNITGTFTGDVKSLGYNINGVDYTGGTINKDGTFAIYVLNKIISPKDEVFVYGFDQYGKKIAEDKVKLVDNSNQEVGQGTVIPDEFLLGENSYLTGTYTGDVVAIRVVVNGKTYTGGTLNSDGTFQFYARGTITSTKETVILEGYDKQGNKIDSKPVVVKTIGNNEIGKGTIKGNAFVIPNDSNVTGTFTGDVVSLSLIVAGTEYTGGKLNADGTFSFYAWDKIKSDVAVTVNGFDKNGNHIATSPVVIKDNTIPSQTKGTITLNELTVPGSTHINGTYTGDVYSFVTVINGTRYGGGLASKGQLSIYIWGKIKSAQDIVQVIAYDKFGKELDRKVPNLMAPEAGKGTLKETSFKLGSSTLTGGYTGDVKSIKVSVNGTVYTGGTVKDGAYSFYIFRKITHVTDEVKVTAYDANGNKLADVFVKVLP